MPYPRLWLALGCQQDSVPQQVVYGPACAAWHQNTFFLAQEIRGMGPLGINLSETKRARSTSLTYTITQEKTSHPNLNSPSLSLKDEVVLCASS